MSDDPWAKYTSPGGVAAPQPPTPTTPVAPGPAPAASADPWAKYTGTAPAAAATSTAPSGQSTQPTWTDYLLQHLAAGSPWDPNAPAKTLATTPFWNKPADASWGDYAAAHLQPLDDTVRAAANTFGGDRFAAMMDRLTGTGPTSTELVNRVATGQPTDMLSIERARSAAAAQRDPSMTAAGNVLGGTMLAPAARRSCTRRPRNRYGGRPYIQFAWLAGGSLRWRDRWRRCWQRPALLTWLART